MTIRIVASLPFEAATAGDILRSAIGSLPPSGGTVDARSMVGDQVIDHGVNIFSEAKGPVTLLLGKSHFRIYATQVLRSDTTIKLDGTTLTRMQGGSDLILLGDTMTSEGADRGAAIHSTHPRQLTLGMATSSDFLSRLQVGGLIGVFGHLLVGNRDETTLTGAVSPTETTLPVVRTEIPGTNPLITFPTPTNPGVPDARYLRIGTELIKYVSTSPTQFLQCTRGAFGSPIPTLNYEGGTPVERCVYRKFEIVDIATENGSTVLTVDRDLDVEGDEIPIVVGTSNVAIIGNGTIQFGYSTMSLQVCIFGNVSNNWYVGDGIRLRSFNSAGCTASLSSDWFVDVHADAWGSSSNGDAANGVVLGRSVERSVVLGSFEGKAGLSNSAVFVDERSVHGIRYDGGTLYNYVAPRTVHATRYVARLECGFRNVIRTGASEVVEDLVSVNITQWVSDDASMEDNDIVIHLQPSTDDLFAPGGHSKVRSNSISFPERSVRTVREDSEPGSINNNVDWPAKSADLGSTAVISVDLRLGNHFYATVGNNDVTVGPPKFGFVGHSFSLTLHNDSGNAGGTVTFDEVFLTDGPLSSPGSHKHRTISFANNGDHWMEFARTGELG